MEKQRREKMKVDCGTWLITLLNKAFYRMKKVAGRKKKKSELILLVGFV